ncbi:DNA replication licensing factor mcm8 [Coemansia sp. RSA 2050]|nr:DNA replication licensing factor mcm8 [Coemansia sp. RSA 2050]KAJ2731423.1 DNA replication licensing factor mcm8 [Coemansia sp. BCRC 34962]
MDPISSDDNAAGGTRAGSAQAGGAGTKRTISAVEAHEGFSLHRVGRYWPLYFPRVDYNEAPNEHIEDIKKLVEYVRQHPETFSMDTMHSCMFSYLTLVEASPLAGFAQRLRDESEVILSCLGLAVCYVLSCEYGTEGEHVLGDHRLHIRLKHHEPVTHMKSLKSALVGRLVTVRGTVVRTSPIKPFLTQCEFTCARCGGSQLIRIAEGRYEEPVKCLAQGCRSRVFELCRSVRSGTRTVDWQQIRIQEKVNDDPKDPGRVPRNIDAELLNDLVDCVVPGDVVSCTGIVKAALSDEGKGKGRPNSLYILYLDAIAVHKVGGTSNADGPSVLSSGEDTTTKDGIHFTQKDYQFIREVFKEPKLFRLLVNSFCPGIYGHELVKAGIMLALFGARKREANEPGSLNIRSDSHVLIVGDPGLGKSQMLTAVGQIAPRGVYVCGTSGVSSSGLTVTLVKEAGSGDFALEAGALVLSDMGCCAIDEFDKVSSEHSSLLEAMEQQSISIAKGGLVCSLPARASVIAAANPAGGHYNKAKTVAENLKINSALLSRFDLIFILLDKPNADMDRFLSEHVMALHSGKKPGGSGEAHSAAGATAAAAGDNAGGDNGCSTNIKQWLQLQPGEKLDPIPPALLRKYVAYARKYVHPTLSEEAKAKLKKFYLELRQGHQAVDSTPITTRQLEALVRLAEARARAELREVVTESDADNVIEIMKYSLFQTYEDEEGVMDFGRSQMGTGTSRTNDMKRLVERLHKISEETYNNMFTYDMLLRTATEMNLRFSNFQDVIDKLNNQSYLIKKGPRSYQLATF